MVDAFGEQYGKGEKSAIGISLSGNITVEVEWI